MHSKAKTIEQYIRTLQRPAAQAVRKLDRIIRKATPRVEPTMDHRMPFYKVGGKPYIAVACQKHGLSVYAVDMNKTLAANLSLRKALARAGKGKNCLRFTPAQLDSIPYPAIGKLIRLTYRRVKD